MVFRHEAVEDEEKCQPKHETSRKYEDYCIEIAASAVFPSPVYAPQVGEVDEDHRLAGHEDVREQLAHPSKPLKVLRIHLHEDRCQCHHNYKLTKEETLVYDQSNPSWARHQDTEQNQTQNEQSRTNPVHDRGRQTVSHIIIRAIDSRRQVLHEPRPIRNQTDAENAQQHRGEVDKTIGEFNERMLADQFVESFPQLFAAEVEAAAHAIDQQVV